MNGSSIFVIAGLMCLHAAGAAERGGGSSLVGDSKMSFDLVAGYVVAAAEKMPEEQYAFKPVPDVRNYAQLVGHIADAQYLGCSAVSGEKRAPSDIEKSKSGKAELIIAVKAAFAYCQGTWSKMTDASASERIELFGRERAKLAALDLGTAHVFEHYGNMVTYMRLKGIVPPSSEK